MSDYIDRAKRQETLKGLIQDLHAGKTVDQVKATFAELLQDVGAAEIAELEQNLIAEGMSEMEVKRLCDVHVQVFRESLDAQAETRPETIPGHPVHTFLAENAAAGPVLDSLGATLAQLRDSPTPTALVRAHQELDHLREYEKHYLRKENILFPYLEKHNFSGPSTVMWAIHDDVRANWKALAALLAAGPGGDPAGFAQEIDGQFATLRTAISEMFYKEENILFPTALQKLSHEEWVAMRKQEPEVGYCYVKPGERWLPMERVESDAGELLTLGASAPPVAAEPAADGKLKLDTGVLTPQQVNLLLTHLPVEITFVDKNDQVAYYSQTKELMFPRSPATIGRKVQHCHPPGTVHRVQQILDDFRAGRRDVAEFWIRMKGLYIFIRYFAIRDAAGEYQGTMEVTQEITRIQALRDERRLLDEGEQP